jgi:hypothetical protein
MLDESTGRNAGVSRLRRTWALSLQTETRHAASLLIISISLRVKVRKAPPLPHFAVLE